jgi:hypothetical protein
LLLATQFDSLIFARFSSISIKLIDNETSIFQKLNKNSTVFINLNVSTFNVLNTNSMTKLDNLFNLFAGINSNFSSFGIILTKKNAKLSFCFLDFIYFFLFFIAHQKKILPTYLASRFAARVSRFAWKTSAIR